MSPDTIIKLVQVGGLSAALGFLYLGYQLLSREGEKPEPSSRMLMEIRMFNCFALLFFVVGTTVQFVFCRDSLQANGPM
jgi:hypothetical protein